MIIKLSIEFDKVIVILYECKFIQQNIQFRYIVITK